MPLVGEGARVWEVIIERASGLDRHPGAGRDPV